MVAWDSERLQVVHDGAVKRLFGFEGSTGYQIDVYESVSVISARRHGESVWFVDYQTNCLVRLGDSETLYHRAMDGVDYLFLIFFGVLSSYLYRCVRHRGS